MPERCHFSYLPPIRQYKANIIVSRLPRCLRMHPRSRMLRIWIIQPRSIHFQSSGLSRYSQRPLEVGALVAASSAAGGAQELSSSVLQAWAAGFLSSLKKGLVATPYGKVSWSRSAAASGSARSLISTAVSRASCSIHEGERENR